MQPAWAPAHTRADLGSFQSGISTPPPRVTFHGFSVMHQIAAIMILHFGDRRAVTTTTEQLPNRWLRQGGNTGRGSGPDAGLGWTAQDLIMALGMASDFKIMNYFWIFPFNILGPRLTKSNRNRANKITLHSDSF